MKYTKKQIKELEKKFPNLLNFDSLYRNYRNNPKELEIRVMEAILRDRGVTLSYLIEALEAKESAKKAKVVMLTKMLIKEKKGIEMSDYLNLNIEVESENVTWLRDGKVKLMGYENLDHLISELKDIIEIDDNFKINLLDEEKLTQAILFL